MRRLIQYALKLFSIAILAKYRPKVVAVTGSVGKSSAKEAVFAVLSAAWPGRVRKTENNLNTEIGVPLAIIGGAEAGRDVSLWLKNLFSAARLVLFKAGDYPEILVLEMAADRPGDIEYLTSFIPPDAAVVTAVGEMPSHLEFFPERDRYVEEKAALVKNLKPGGAAILNYDDLSVREFRNRVPTGRRRVYYGFQTGADLRLADFSWRVPASAAEVPEAGMEARAEDSLSGEAAEFKLPGTLGLPALYAALAGLAAGRVFGLGLKEMARALAGFKVPDHRLKILKGVKETIVIDDSYNSSPIACEAALELLGKFKKNRKVAALGSMRELGINTEPAHRRIGLEAAKVADVLLLAGDEMVFAREEAQKIGLELGEDLFWFETARDAAKKVKEILRPGDAVLIKGSRGVRMETVVEEIT